MLANAERPGSQGQACQGNVTSHPFGAEDLQPERAQVTPPDNPEWDRAAVQRVLRARESVEYNAVVRIFGVKLGPVAEGPDHPVWVTGAGGFTGYEHRYCTIPWRVIAAQIAPRERRGPR